MTDTPKPDKPAERCPTCGDLATFHDTMGTLWDSKAHHWRPKDMRSKEEIAADYYRASGRANSVPTQATLDRIDASEKRQFDKPGHASAPEAPANFVSEVTNQVPGPSCKLCGAAMHPTFHCDSCGSISGCTGPNDVRVGAASAQRHEIELVQRIAIRLSEMGFAFRADHSTMQVSIDPVEEATLPTTDTLVDSFSRIVSEAKERMSEEEFRQAEKKFDEVVTKVRGSRRRGKGRKAPVPQVEDWIQAAAQIIYDDMANPDSAGMSVDQMAAIIAKHCPKGERT